MDRAFPQQNKAISTVRKRKLKEIIDHLDANKQNSMPDIGIGKLSDDLLIAILSGLSLVEAARTSVLSRRWKYLWISAIRDLEFHETRMIKRNFISCVNTVVKLYKPQPVDSLIIHFSYPRSFGPKRSSISRAVNSWIRFALQKGVHRLGLGIPEGLYTFPNIEKMLTYSPVGDSPFRSLRSLRLFYVDIEDEVVHYFLTSCPHLEELCISCCCATKNLHVVDPPNLKVLEIGRCPNLQTLEVSAVNLVSLTYEGVGDKLILKEIPNLRELTLGDDISYSFIVEPQKHSNYSVQLVKLRLDFSMINERYIPLHHVMPPLCSLKRLELVYVSLAGRNLNNLSSLIKASPQLCELRIEISCIRSKGFGGMLNERLAFDLEAVKYEHKNLELVEIAGYIGTKTEEKFLLHLFDVAMVLKRIVFELRHQIPHLVLPTFPPCVEFIVK